MLSLLSAQHGPNGALRRYLHPRLGVIETITTWREPGAHIIRIDTERDREKRRAMANKILGGTRKSKKGRSRSTDNKAAVAR